MSATPRALVIRTAGTNCDGEMVRAFEAAGAAPDLVHLGALLADPARLRDYHLIGLPGGFSYGDDIASGRVLAVKLRERLYPALREAARRGVPMIGACNGFQVLVQVGLLPGPAPGEDWPASPPPQTTALTDNIAARFVDRWLAVEFEPSSRCVWTRGLAGAAVHPDARTLPIAHGEGRFVADSPATLAALERSGQVALRYAEGHNVNGSEGRVAGICDPSGLIFGLMPHPERYLEWAHHPSWTRLDPAARAGDTPGLLMFRNAVDWARARAGDAADPPTRALPLAGAAR